METIYEVKTSRVRLRVQDTGTKVSDPSGVVPLVRSIFERENADQEHFVLLCLNKANQVRAMQTVFSGGQTETAVDLKVLFRFALLNGAAAIIVAHNHPSGRTEPSLEDRTITQKIKASAEVLGITFLDHIILGAEDAYYSFREGGLL